MVDQVLARYKCGSNTAVRFKLGEATCWCSRKFMVTYCKIYTFVNMYVCFTAKCPYTVFFLCVFITIFNALFDDASHFFSLYV